MRRIPRERNPYFLTGRGKKKTWLFFLWNPARKRSGLDRRRYAVQLASCAEPNWESGGGGAAAPGGFIESFDASIGLWSKLFSTPHYDSF
jgi:hypothetical protein